MTKQNEENYFEPLFKEIDKLANEVSDLQYTNFEDEEKNKKYNKCSYCTMGFNVLSDDPKEESEYYYNKEFYRLKGSMILKQASKGALDGLPNTIENIQKYYEQVDQVVVDNIIKHAILGLLKAKAMNDERLN